jgi:hypothetical protein
MSKDVKRMLEQERAREKIDHDAVMAELERERANEAMTPTQQRQIAEVLTAMNFAEDGPEVKDILYRIGASENAWRWRALTKPQAASVLELLRRFLETRRRI